MLFVRLHDAFYQSKLIQIATPYLCDLLQCAHLGLLTVCPVGKLRVLSFETLAEQHTGSLFSLSLHDLFNQITFISFTLYSLQPKVCGKLLCLCVVTAIADPTLNMQSGIWCMHD